VVSFLLRATVLAQSLPLSGICMHGGFRLKKLSGRLHTRITLDQKFYRIFVRLLSSILVVGMSRGFLEDAKVRIWTARVGEFTV
jgi:hypothetical protein